VEAKLELMVDNMVVEAEEDNKPVGPVVVVHNNPVGVVVDSHIELVADSHIEVVVDSHNEVVVDNPVEPVGDSHTEMVVDNFVEVDKLAELVVVLYYSFDQMADYPVV